jgi:DNA invertase Pin-like site-specific DNA recombinase
MRLAAYLRVSTDAQTDGLGLDVQDTACKKWAANNGHRIRATFTDAGVSGANGLNTRTGLADAFAALKAERVAGLVVYKLDRLARDLIVQEQILAELRRGGWAVFSTSASESQYLTDDPADPSRKLIRQVLGAVSEYERSMIVMRLRSGRARKAAEGRFAYGSPPYGFAAENGELVPIPEEQATLARIRELRGEGRSLRVIAAVLTAEGIKPRRGGTWHPRVLARLVER